ncbi:MAG: hypothetical protein IJ038_05420 [Clostridia bacterium]|nr:hypothetical protein [Clostridia bacterium]
MNIFENISIDRFLGSLRYMGEGMICIFIVIGVIILSIYGMNAAMSKIAQRKKDKENAENQND